MGDQEAKDFEALRLAIKAEQAKQARCRRLGLRCKNKLPKLLAQITELTQRRPDLLDNQTVVAV